MPSDEEIGPAEAAQELDIGSVPTETAEETATWQETIVHPETALEEATRQQILQKQLAREAGARKQRERRAKLTPQQRQQARETDACRKNEIRHQMNTQELQQTRDNNACINR